MAPAGFKYSYYPLWHTTRTLSVFPNKVDTLINNSLKSADPDIRSHVEELPPQVCGTADKPPPAVRLSHLVNNRRTCSIFHFPDRRKMRTWVLPWQPTIESTHRPTRPVQTHTHTHKRTQSSLQVLWGAGREKTIRCFYTLTGLVNAKSVTVFVRLCVFVLVKLLKEATGVFLVVSRFHLSLLSAERRGSALRPRFVRAELDL